LKKTEKLKFDKKFQAVTVDAEDELFVNGIFVFNVTKLTAHMKANPGQFPLQEVAINSLGKLCNNLNEYHICSVDLTVPIILAEISPARFSIIDGNHRVEKARRDGIRTLLAYRVGPHHHHRFLTSVTAYKKYVEYWNSKAEDI